MKDSIYDLFLAQIEVNVIKKIDKDDIIRFYDHYVSPHSNQRRKLALHVVPSPLALQSISEKSPSPERQQESDSNRESSSPKSVTESVSELLTEESTTVEQQGNISATSVKELSPTRIIKLPEVKILNHRIFYCELINL